MANKAATLDRSAQGTSSVSLAKWQLSSGDVGLPIQMTDFADRSVQVSGAFGSGAVAIEGSNDGVDWFTLRDPTGTALNFSSANLKQIMECSNYIRCKATTVSNVTVTMCLRLGSASSWSR